MDICIDFDGTCVSNEFPEIGKDIGSVPVLKKLIGNGHKLILFTMRSDIDKVTSNDVNIHKQGGKYLTSAIAWFRNNNVSLYGVNTNPTQHFWTKSPKAYCQLYIDDTALGCPLVEDVSISDKPFVDWVKVEEMLIEKGII